MNNKEDPETKMYHITKKKNYKNCVKGDIFVVLHHERHRKSPTGVRGPQMLKILFSLLAANIQLQISKA